VLRSSTGEVNMRGDQGKYPHVARLIRSRILRGVYGDRLPGEDRLAGELRVSPGTVRTALAYLEGQGFIRRERRRGTFVVHPDSAPRERRAAFIDHTGGAASAITLKSAHSQPPSDLSMARDLKNSGNSGFTIPSIMNDRNW